MKEEFVRFWLLHFRKLNLSQKEHRQALIDTFINAIYLYDDKVLITFNYKEGTETVSFGEATEAAAKERSSDMDCLGAPNAPQCVKALRGVFCQKTGSSPSPPHPALRRGPGAHALFELPKKFPLKTGKPLNSPPAGR